MASATVQDFITPKYEPMNARQDGQSPRLMSVKDFVNGVATNDLLTPLQAADLIEQYAEAGLRSVNGLTAGTNKELRFTLGDIKAMAWLGRYYAEKIRGAVDLYRYQKAGNTNDHQNAVAHLQTASTHWSRYAALWSTQYVGQVLIRLGSGLVDMQAIQTYVDRDIQVDRDLPAPPSDQSAKGQFLDAHRRAEIRDAGRLVGAGQRQPAQREHCQREALCKWHGPAYGAQRGLSVGRRFRCGAGEPGERSLHAAGRGHRPCGDDQFRQDHNYRGEPLAMIMAWPVRAGWRHAPDRDQRAGALERCPGCDQSFPGRHHQPRTILSRETMKPAKPHVPRRNSKRALTAAHRVVLQLPLCRPTLLLEKTSRAGALALLGLTALGSSSLQAQMVTNNPVEAPGPLSNPLMGFRNDLNSYS